MKKQKRRLLQRVVCTMLCCIMVISMLPQTAFAATVNNTGEIIAWSQTLPTDRELKKLTWNELVNKGYVQTAKDALAYIAQNQAAISPTVIVQMDNLVELCEYAAALEVGEQCQQYQNADSRSWSSLSADLKALANFLQNGNKPLFTYM